MDVLARGMFLFATARPTKYDRVSVDECAGCLLGAESPWRKEHTMLSSKRITTRGALPAVLGLAGLVFWFAIRPWYTHWGATDDEVRRPLPGDELIPAPQPLSLRTKAVTIDAPAEQV